MNSRLAPTGYIYIYALIDPRDSTYRYIGQAVDLDQTYAKLLSTTNYGSEIELGFWLVALTELGYYPKLEVLALVKECWGTRVSEVFIVDGYLKGWLLANLLPNNSTLPLKPSEWLLMQQNPIDQWPDEVRYAMTRGK
jgi:hypothetical protein